MDKPTHIIYYPRDNLILSKTWEDSDSQYHRINGPATIHYGLNGEILHERWYIHGKSYRGDKPAMVSYYENGDVKSERWFMNGQKGRLEGPALIDYFGGDSFHITGNIQYEEWWINGVKVEPLYTKWPLTTVQQVEFKLKHG